MYGCQGVNALMVACSKGHPACVAVLVTAGADVGAKDNDVILVLHTRFTHTDVSLTWCMSLQGRTAKDHAGSNTECLNALVWTLSLQILLICCVIESAWMIWFVFAS